MADDRRGYLKLPKPQGLPEDEFNLLDEKETSIGEDIDNLGYSMKKSFDVGIASQSAKWHDFKGGIQKSQSENYLLGDEQRASNLEGMKESETEIIERRKEYKRAKEERDNGLSQINNPLLRIGGGFATGMISDYSDLSNTAVLVGMLALTRNAQASYGLSKLSIALNDVVMDGVEEAGLNFTTQMFLEGKENIDWLEVINSGLYGSAGGMVLPSLMRATGRGFSKLKGVVGNSTIKEISEELVSKSLKETKSKLHFSELKNKQKYAKGDYDSNMINDMSKIQTDIDNTSTYTGVLRDGDDMIGTVNGKPLTEDMLRVKKPRVERVAPIINTKLEIELFGKKNTGTPNIIEGKGKKEMTTSDIKSMTKEMLEEVDEVKIVEVPVDFKEIPNRTSFTGDNGNLTSLEGKRKYSEQEIKFTEEGKSPIQKAKSELKWLEENGEFLERVFKGNKAKIEGYKNYLKKISSIQLSGNNKIDMMDSSEFSKAFDEVNKEVNVSKVEQGGIAVNDIGVDNKKAVAKLFDPIDVKPKRVFTSTIEDIDLAREVESEIAKNLETNKIISNDIKTLDKNPTKESIDRINDFMEENDIEDFPLIKTNTDGSVDLGGKTKSDFEILLQLFSDPIDKSSADKIFKNVILKRATKTVDNMQGIIKNIQKEASRRLGRPLKIRERGIIQRNFIKENLYSSFKSAENEAMVEFHYGTTYVVDGDRYGAKEIFNLLEKDGNEGYLGRALFDGGEIAKDKGAGIEMQNVVRRFDNSIRKLVEGNSKTDFDNIHSSLLFDPKKLYFDSLSDADIAKYTDKDHNINFDMLTPEGKAEIEVFAFDMFAKNNADKFDKKIAKKVWENFSMHGKASSQLEGTALHQLGNMQKFKDGKLIDSNIVRALAERYPVTDRVLYNKMVEATANANGLYDTFGYKPRNTLNRMFSNYQKGNPLSQKSKWLYGETAQAWTLKTDTNSYASMIFDDEIGRKKGQMPFAGQRFIRYKAMMDSIGLGFTELPPEIISHITKRLMIGKTPMMKVVGQTIKSLVQMHSLTKKMASETTDPFLKKQIGSLGALYEFMITKGNKDYSGASADFAKTMTPKEKAIFRSKEGIGRCNFIEATDRFGDRLAILAVSNELDQFGKIGYNNIKGNIKHQYIASKLDEFGIGVGTFDIMTNAPRGEFGLRDYDKLTKQELGIYGEDPTMELKRIKDFNAFLGTKMGFAKPDVEFLKAKNLYKDENTKFLDAVNLYWKKTMITKLRISKELLTTTNTYAGLGKTFDWSNVDHYTRTMESAIALGLAGYGSSYLDRLVYGYEIDDIENLNDLIAVIFNQQGFYTMTDQSSLMRNTGRVINGKTIESKVKGVIGLVAPPKVVKQIERIAEVME